MLVRSRENNKEEAVIENDIIISSLVATAKKSPMWHGHMIEMGRNRQETN